MPIYEYKCRHCSHQIEILQKINDEPAKNCPACGQDFLYKMVSAAAFKLKGTGWYETDFKDKKPKTDKKPSSKTDGSDMGTKKDNVNNSKKETSGEAIKTTKSSTKTADPE